ncbi:MAG: tetratricopeptide repeat protein [Planctomycetes bacterium]|nr:tetratricopeptide repeat protein [Planctomycetota bacterium]
MRFAALCPAVPTAIGALMLLGCASTPMPAIPDDPNAALELGAGLLPDHPQQARYVLESIDASAFDRAQRERLDFHVTQALAGSGDLWDAYQRARDFAANSRFSEYQPRLQELHYRIGVALLDRDRGYFIFGSDQEDGRIVLSDFVERYPTDPNTASALQRLGEEDFEAGRWDEARRRYERIIEDHPDSEWIPLAHFRRPMAQFNALVGPEYDLPSMRRARAELRDYLLVRKPERPDFREPAEVALRTVERWIAMRYEIDADYYRTLGNRPGEAHWLRVLLAEFPDHERATALQERLAAAEATGTPVATPPGEVRS